MAVPPDAGPEVPYMYASWNDVSAEPIPADSSPRVARAAVARAAPLTNREETGVVRNGLSLIGTGPF
jgi:hypothetical protein